MTRAEVAGDEVGALFSQASLTLTEVEVVVVVVEYSVAGRVVWLLRVGEARLMAEVTGLAWAQR